MRLLLYHKISRFEEHAESHSLKVITEPISKKISDIQPRSTPSLLLFFSFYIYSL